MKYIDNFKTESYYHVFNHAVGDECLFRDEGNYYFFLTKFGHYILPIAKTFAYCLMPNHFHFFIQFRNEEEIIKHYQLINEKKAIEEITLDFHKFLMQQFSNFLNSYTKSFNKVFNRKGALFLDYTRRVEVTDPQYFKNVVCYINNNPVHHGFCKHPGEWKFSSYLSLTQTNSATKIEREKLMEWFVDNYSITKEHAKKNSMPNDYMID